MSISATLSSALSGLSATSRQAQVISNNIANAATPGYGRREVMLGTRLVGRTGQGVEVTGIRRHMNAHILQERRLADALVGHRGVRAAFYGRMEQSLGTPDQAGSLSGRIASFDSALLAAASRPDSEARLADVANSARSLARSFSDASDAIQAARVSADQEIGAQVERLNTVLARIAEANTQIRTAYAAGGEETALIDQRQALIDELATIVPVREVDRGNGVVALFTTGGAVLLDGLPATFGFDRTGFITPEMTLASGGLSGLTLNGRDVDMTNEAGLMAGGSLAGLFDLRDGQAVEAQAKLDAVARDLLERVAGADPTLNPGDAGLFTDGGAAFDPLNEVGLSARLAINAAADPEQGGDLFRLRDGMNAATPGESGDASLLLAIQAALTDPRVPASGGFMSGERSLSALAADLLSGISGARLSAESDVSYAEARADALYTAELEEGVDTDAEMQKLLMVEQSYAANAKVVQTVEELVRILLNM